MKAEVEFDGYHNEAGLCWKFHCPKCEDELTAADSQWWDSTCSCGLKWRVTWSAIAEARDAAKGETNG